ncbi:hypothetical protein [Granulicella arctica]|uniref:Uncharacterized protein n=1 Tax=Granulicella arctica TaxID=940613 RepID=A0A7Y9PH66_9BACT|nr:hypothetical protein [Granulicella arctica]NYF79679.1 hypothetical protein [Granulicella arctica]
METPLCRHIKANGIQCRAVALTENPFCYAHDRMHRFHKSYRLHPMAKSYLNYTNSIQLNALEDRESVQLAISQVVNALATNQLESKRAAVLLYGLQLAARNITLLKPAETNTVRSVQTTSDGLDLAEANPTLELTLESPEPKTLSA